MSTKPPTAVMIPSVSSSGFKTVLDALEGAGMGAQLFGTGIVSGREEAANFIAVIALRLSQRAQVDPQLLAQPGTHRLRVGRGDMARRRLLIHQRPFGGERAGFTDRRQVGFPPL